MMSCVYSHSTECCCSYSKSEMCLLYEQEPTSETSEYKVLMKKTENRS